MAHTTQPIGLQQPVIRLPEHFGSEPMSIVCNVCRQHIQTSTTSTCNPICCFLFGCFALCCCQDVEHKCPSCNAVLGKKTAVG